MDLVAIVTQGRGHSTVWTPWQDWEPLGYEPIPGTLNLWCQLGRLIPPGAPIIERIATPGEGLARTRVGLYTPCLVNGIPCHVRPFRERSNCTHVEAVSAHNLRRELRLRDGDAVTLTFH